MKLIPARCPSCGADIEVNKNNETTKCKYCETRIFIDDAIAKYKVEIQNMPTAKSYLKVGTRNLNSRDFIKAHEQLEKALEIDPDNAEIIVKETLAKVLAKEVTESNLNKILNAFKDAKEFCDEETLDELILYTLDLMEPNRNFVTSIINSNPRGDVFTRMLYKYTFFINFYERTFRNYASGVEVKKQLIYKIFATVQCYLNGGRYTEPNSQGYLTTYTYKIPKDMINFLNNKKVTYENELAKIDDEFRINLEKRREKENTVVPTYKNKKFFEQSSIPKEVLVIDGIIAIIAWMWLLLFLMVFLLGEAAVSAIAAIISIILCTPYLVIELIPGCKSLNKVFKWLICICRYFVAFMFFIVAVLAVPTVEENVQENETPTDIVIVEPGTSGNSCGEGDTECID